MVFFQTWGGGRGGYIKNQTPSAIMCFLKWACKTILGPLKHVLHLVWSVYVTSKAIKTALKVELLRFFFTLDASPWLGQIMVSKKKSDFFLLKIRFRHYRSIFHQKNEEKKFFTGKLTKKDQTGGRGGGPRGGWQKTIFFPDFFFATFPYYIAVFIFGIIFSSLNLKLIMNWKVSVKFYRNTVPLVVHNNSFCCIVLFSEIIKKFKYGSIFCHGTNILRKCCYAVSSHSLPQNPNLKTCMSSDFLKMAAVSVSVSEPFYDQQTAFLWST